MKTKLYVWDKHTRQIIIVDKESCKLLDEQAPNRKRMLVVDDAYDGRSSGRYGSYLFSNDECMLGTWIGDDISYFPHEFRAQLLLLGVE